MSGPGTEAKGGDPSVLLGTVEVVTYHDEGTCYTVLRVALEAGCEVPSGDGLFGSPRVTAVGRTRAPIQGQRVRLAGRWTEHRTHGSQFEFEIYEPLPPSDREGLVRLLASKAFEGVGETLAQRIVDTLGENALEKILEDPACLHGIRGLRPEVATNLATKVSSQLSSYHAQAFLRGLGLGTVLSMAVIDHLGEGCEELIRHDPFRLATVPGIGFTSADRLAEQLGIEGGDPRRLAAAILHALESSSSDGHSLQGMDELRDRTAQLLSREVDPEAFRSVVDELYRDERLVLDQRPGSTSEGEGERLAYLPWLHHSEAALADNLGHLIDAAPVRALATQEQLEVAARAAKLDLHPDQEAAVLALLSAPVALLTGGPGVGKTTIVRLVVALAEGAGAKVHLASPTGRAAKRLSEATGRDASTIHRLLGFRPGGGWEHDAQNPLQGDLVIVDEASMLDVALAHHLVKAIQPPTRLVLVGDPDQLPSVGAGNVLVDLIGSGVVPVARLSRIFRQDESSLIVANAHRIRDGEDPVLPDRGDRASDFYLFTADTPEAIGELLVDVVTRRVPETFGLDWTEDVQVISPMYRGPCGVDALNDALREAQGYGGREVRRGEQRWRVGDRVIQTRNDYEREVFNGDMGRISSITGEGELIVRFAEQDVAYSGGNLSDLRPAFAITVHRSQGAEFPCVVMPVVTQHALMLQRNLLYTGITRARKLVVLVGTWRALRMAVANADPSRRESALRDRLAHRTPGSTLLGDQFELPEGDLGLPELD